MLIAKSNRCDSIFIQLIATRLLPFSPLQERALQLVDQTEGDFDITEGIRLVQTDEPTEARSLNDEHLSDDQETREQEVDSLLVDRVSRFLGSHTLQFKVPKDSIKDVQRSLDEGEFVDEVISRLP